MMETFIVFAEFTVLSIPKVTEKCIDASSGKFHDRLGQVLLSYTVVDM